MSMGQKELPDTNADTIKARAAEWLERRDREDWSEADQAALDAWLAQSMAHQTAFWRLEAAWDRTARLAALRAPMQAPFVPASPPRLSPVLVGIAAALALVAGLGVAAVLLLRPEDRVYATAIGGRETVAFADGTKIELNTNTQLRARMTTQERIVWLDHGEAYFEVKHDPAHPFVVMVGNRRVTDLGTQFSIHRGAHDLEVAVVDGRVWFDAPDNKAASQNSLLTSGEVATINADKFSVTRRSAKELAVELAWRRGMLVFHDTRLADAVREFNRYNAIKLVVADPSIADLKFSAEIRADNYEDFLQLAQTVLRLHVDRVGNSIFISRAGGRTKEL